MNFYLLNKISVIFFCLFLFLLPFQIWQVTIFPAQTGKTLFAGWALLVLFIFLLGHIAFSKSFTFKISITDFGLILYLLFFFIHSYFIKPVFFHPFIIIELQALVVVYLLVRIQNEKTVIWIITTLALVAFAQSLWGVLQYFSFLPSQHKSFKVTGTFFNPAPFAG
jgi:hypothetical protein